MASTTAAVADVKNSRISGKPLFKTKNTHLPCKDQKKRRESAKSIGYRRSYSPFAAIRHDGQIANPAENVRGPHKIWTNVRIWEQGSLESFASFKSRNFMAQQWYAQFDGRTVGPFPAKKLRDLATAGTLTPDTQLRIGEGAWFRAARVKGLFERVDSARNGFGDEPSLADSEPAIQQASAESQSLTDSGDEGWSGQDDFLNAESALAPPPIPGGEVPAVAATTSRRDGGAPKYTVLRVYAILFIVAGILSIAIGSFVVLLAMLEGNVAGIAMALAWLAASVGVGMACFVASELMNAVIQVATDTRRSRNALERIERRLSEVD